MNKTKTIVAGAAAAAVLLYTAASCDNKYTEPFKDAPRSGVDNGAPMNVIDGADGFSNIGWKCVGKDGVYAAYHGDKAYAAISVVPNDPNCAVSASPTTTPAH